MRASSDAPSEAPPTSRPDAEEVAHLLQASVGLLSRRLRQVPTPGELTLPEMSALARLDRSGPTTAGALARLEQISAQSMGVTFAALEARGLVARRPDPDDGRRILLSVTDAGLAVLRDKRTARARQLATALSSGFTPAELTRLRDVAPLIERLAQRI